jgi:CxxC-x17-CxxC domain-containing protein
VEIQENLDHGFLGRVLGVSFIPQHRQQHEINRTLAGTNQFVKCMLFSRANAADAFGFELRVGGNRHNQVEIRGYLLISGDCPGVQRYIPCPRIIIAPMQASFIEFFQSVRRGTDVIAENSENPYAENDTVGCTICTRRPMAGDIQLTCSDCGQDFTFSAADQAFFQERGYSTPKRCKPCRMAKKNDQGGGGSGYRSAPAQGTPVICSGCGQPTTVPFEPRGDRPVYCRDCYQSRKGNSPAGAGARGGRGRY